MASIGKAIYSKLSSDPAVTALTTVIMPNYAPQRDIYPQIVYENKDAEPDFTYDGPSGLVKQDFLIRCIGKDYAGTDTLANAVITSLNFQQGVFGGITVLRIFHEDDVEDQFNNPDTEQILYYVRELSFSCWFST